MEDQPIPRHIKVRGAKVHNLKNINVDVPASLALHQRPQVPGIRSTFGTGTQCGRTGF